jgi:hypothetical protein
MTNPPEFFQALNAVQPELQLQLTSLITDLETQGYNGMTDEHLVLYTAPFDQNTPVGSKQG